MDVSKDKKQEGKNVSAEEEIAAFKKESEFIIQILDYAVAASYNDFPFLLLLIRKWEKKSNNVLDPDIYGAVYDKLEEVIIEKLGKEKRNAVAALCKSSVYWVDVLGFILITGDYRDQYLEYVIGDDKLDELKEVKEKVKEILYGSED